jgi:hypothetical protein
MDPDIAKDPVRSATFPPALALPVPDEALIAFSNAAPTRPPAPVPGGPETGGGPEADSGSEAGIEVFYGEGPTGARPRRTTPARPGAWRSESSTTTPPARISAWGW